MTLRLAIEHRTRYDYGAPVTHAQHLAHLKPLADVHQQLLAWELRINPAPRERHEAADSRGNRACWFALAMPHGALTVTALSEVQVAARFVALDAARSPPWDALAAGLRYVARGPFDPAVEFTLPSAYVPRLEALAAYAQPSFTPDRPVAEAAIELMHRVHTDFRYEPASTEVDTPLPKAFAQKRGVCQDFAHLLIGMLRMLGVPARYVSGYLLTVSPDDGDATMLGADATHAWAQVYAPGTPGAPDAWLDLDPTNDLIPTTAHVRLAVGRDYGDVTPLRGVIHGGGRHALSVAVKTRVMTPSPLGETT